MRPSLLPVVQQLQRKGSNEDQQYREKDTPDRSQLLISRGEVRNDQHDVLSGMNDCPPRSFFRWVTRKRPLLFKFAVANLFPMLGSLFIPPRHELQNVPRKPSAARLSKVTVFFDAIPFLAFQAVPITKASRAASITAGVTAESPLIRRMRSTCDSRRWIRRKLPAVMRMIAATQSGLLTLSASRLTRLSLLAAKNWPSS